MGHITLLLGTVSGTAEFATFTLKRMLQSHGHVVIVNEHPAAEDLTQSDSDLLFIITPTTGDGELPENLRPLWQELKKTRPNLNDLKYSSAILGDSNYTETFCQGGQRLDSLLEELGGIRLKTPFLIDANKSFSPEEDITAWGILLANELLGYDELKISTSL